MVMAQKELIHFVRFFLEKFDTKKRKVQTDKTTQTSGTKDEGGKIHTKIIIKRRSTEKVIENG